MEQHPIFIKYKRDWLHKVTEYSKGYLSRVATGKIPLSRSFIERCCYRVKQPESKLFLPVLKSEHRVAGLYLEKDDDTLYLKRGDEVLAKWSTTGAKVTSIWNEADRHIFSSGQQ